MSDTLEHLQSALGYRFKNRQLLKEALTHRSLGRANNERLEFLGDALLGGILADALFTRYPEAQEGALTRMRAHLVCGTTLTEMAHALALGPLLYLSHSEVKMAGRQRASTLENGFEALIGAIYLDGGFEAARHALLRLYHDRLQGLSDATLLSDPKSRLQEHLQQRGASLPLYTLTSVTGTPPEEIFYSRCQLPHNGIQTEASGRTRRGSEQSAAGLALQLLEVSS